MDRTREALEGLVHYEEVSAIRPLETLHIEKEDIPKFIVCPAYERARGRIERSMERYTARVTQAEERLQQSNENIVELQVSIEEWEGRAKGVSFFNQVTLDRTSASSVDRYNRDVARHNEAVEQVRRYQDRLQDSIDKHNDLVERYNEVVREAEDRLEELTLEALKDIDEDLVAFFEKCSSVVDRLRESGSQEDVAAAAEACYLTLKLHNAFEAYIESASARREARERAETIGSTLFELCADKELRAFLEGLFRVNLDLKEQNTERHSRVVSLIEGANPAHLDATRREFGQLLGAKFKTRFSYVGIVDPHQLESVIGEMRDVVAAIRGNLDEARELFESSESLAQDALTAQSQAESLLSTMKSAVEDCRDSLLYQGHFACDLVDPTVIDGFFRGDLHKAAASIRDHICASVGEENLLTLLNDDGDRFLIARTEDAIGKASLTTLQAEREKVEGHVRRLSGLIPGVTEQIRWAEKVPEQNVEAFRSSASFLYPVACFPILGFLAAWVLLYRVQSFASAFSSANRVYQELKVELMERNLKFRKINTYVFINIIAALIFSQIDKRLYAYSGLDTPALEAERTTVGD